MIKICQILMAFTNKPFIIMQSNNNSNDRPYVRAKFNKGFGSIKYGSMYLFYKQIIHALLVNDDDPERMMEILLSLLIEAKDEFESEVNNE